MTQPFNLLSQKGYSTIGRQRHHTSFGEICEWYETGDSDLPGSRKLASPRCLHIGPVANRGFTISQPLPHLQNNCKCFRRRYLSILTRALRSVAQLNFNYGQSSANWIHWWVNSMNLHHWAKTYREFSQASSCVLAMPYPCWPPRRVAQSWEWVMSDLSKLINQSEIGNRFVARYIR